MDYSVKDLENSSIEVIIKVDEKLMKKYKDVELKKIWKDFEMPGFRKWHVPLSIIEQNIDNNDVLSIYDKILSDCVSDLRQSLLYSLIWDVYDMDQEEKDWIINIIFKIDVYPKAQVKNDNWKTIKCKKVDVKVTDNDMENALNDVKEEFAEYKDVGEVSNETFVKLETKYLDKDDKVMGTSEIFFWKDEGDLFFILKEFFNGFIWKKLNYEKKIKYSEDLPYIFIYNKEEFNNEAFEELDTEPVQIIVKIIEIKQKVLPEITIENLEKWYWEEFENVGIFEKMIKREVYKKNRLKLLNDSYENILNQIRESIKVSIPNRLLKKDVDNRLTWEESFRMSMEIFWAQDMNVNKTEIYKKFEKESRLRIEEDIIIKKYLELNWIKEEFDNNDDVKIKVVEYIWGPLLYNRDELFWWKS